MIARDADINELTKLYQDNPLSGFYMNTLPNAGLDHPNHHWHDCPACDGGGIRCIQVGDEKCAKRIAFAVEHECYGRQI